MKDQSMKENNVEINCDVCGRMRSCTLVASSCGPFSYNVCSECLSNGAESLNAILLKIALSNNLDAMQSHFGDIKSFIDGHYAAWPEIKKYYEDNQLEITAWAKEVFGFDDEN